MKRIVVCCVWLFVGVCVAASVMATPIHVTHLWHMHQPIYYPYESVKNTDANGRFNFNIQSEVWDGDRFNCYRNWPADATWKASGHGGSQMSYSGSLVENNNVLWGHATASHANWAENIRGARNNKTSSGNPRLDVVGIAYHHSLMPLTCVESMRMQIRLHQEQFKEVWGTSSYSKGFWPPECAFDSSMIPALVAEGLEWVIVDNGHLFRTVSDFEWSSASSCRPNKADVRNGSSADLASTWVGLPNVWAPTKVLAPWSYQPHYTRYVDPNTGEIKKLIAVPAGRYEGNENGRGGYGAFKPENVWGGNIAANNNPAQPMLLLCHSDGDNYGMKNGDAWNGQHQLFVNMAASNPDFEYTSVQDYLGMYPPNPNDVIHVEPGSWIGIDGGTPYYEKWLSYEDRDGEMPDMWSWSVLVAAQNRVLTADDLENSYLNLSGGRTMDDVEWGLNNDTARAWYYYLNGETSCYWYWDYDRANPWDGNVTRACNLANAEAMKVINRNPSGDRRGPSIFPPQRTPYNPGGQMWDETEPLASDFQVWTFVDDVSGIDHVTLYWRKDKDGTWPIGSIENETYAGGDGVEAWQAVSMTSNWWPGVKGSLVPDPSARAQRYMATISDQSECLIDYFVEAVDGLGNTNRSNIIHVWVGEQTGGSGGPITPVPTVWARGTYSYPANGDATSATPVYINTEAGPAGANTSVRLGYTADGGVTWNSVEMAVNPDWTSTSGGSWFNYGLGLFEAGTELEFYVEVTDGTTTNWDNNGGKNFLLSIQEDESGEEPFWVGNTSHATTTDAITITTETWPMDTASAVTVMYSIDSGLSWLSTACAISTRERNNDIWTGTIAPFADGTRILYYIVADRATGTSQIDDNNTENYVAFVGDAAAIYMVEHTPGLTAAGSPDNEEDVFDFDTSGGALGTSGTSGFGYFGNLYVNFDSTNLYIGANSVALPDDSTNNAYIVFLSGGSLPGSGTFWDFSGVPLGLDELHNVEFNPPVNMAILLGDVWGDGTFENFDMYSNAEFNFGQGVFLTPAAGAAFETVDGARLSQFGSYGLGDRLAANWECAIPLSTFGVGSALELTNLYVSGLMVTKSTTNNNRFISGKYLGDDATLGNNEQADEYGNFAYSFVHLNGSRVGLPLAKTTQHGVPLAWVNQCFGTQYVFSMTSDFDDDGYTDREEYFLGLNPVVPDVFQITDWSDNRLSFHKSSAHICQYHVEIADSVISNAWNFRKHYSFSATNGETLVPASTHDIMMIRLRVDVPGE